MLQVHYDISFEIKSQRFNNDILAEQGCATIKKNKHFLIFIAEIWQYFANSWIL